MWVWVDHSWVFWLLPCEALSWLSRPAPHSSSWETWQAEVIQPQRAQAGLSPPHSCGQSGTQWERGGQGRSGDLLNSSPERSKVWAGAPESQHKGLAGRAGPPLDSKSLKTVCAEHSGLCHNTALFIPVTFHSTLFLFLMWPRFLLMMIICVFIKVSFLAVSLAECITVSPHLFWWHAYIQDNNVFQMHIR